MKSISHLFRRYLINRQSIFLISAFCIVCGLLGSRALISIGMIAWITVALIQTNTLKDIKLFFYSPELWSLSMVFFVYFFWGLHSNNIQDWLISLRIKLPFLAIPLAVVTMRKYNTAFYRLIFYFFFWTMALSSILVFANYLIHYNTINEMMTHGKPIPVPYNHIRFNLMLVFSIIIGLHLYSKRYYIFFKIERVLLLIISIWFIVFLHVLSVRSGMMVFYVLVLVKVLNLLLKKAYRFWAIALLFLLISGPVIAYYSLDSFRNKIIYTQFDLKRYLNDESTKGTSDGRRLLSIQAGFKVFVHNPWFGVGVGDVRDQLTQVYHEKYPEIPDNFIVHNQYVFWLAALGLCGFSLMIFFIFFPLLYKKGYSNWLILSFYLVMAGSFLVEATIEAQIGTALFLFFIPLGLNYAVVSEKEVNEHNILL